MTEFKEKYINPFTDYGFKRLFGEETNKVFYDKLTFIYFEMPKFNKTESQLVTKFDKWLFVMRNLNKLDRIPVELKENIFLKTF